MGFSITVMQPKTNISYDGTELVTLPIDDPCPDLAIVLLRLREVEPSPAMHILLSQYDDFSET
jgi:hypothetical protein